MIYYVPQEGLGNIVQTTPAVKFLMKRGPVMLVTNPHTEKFIHAVFQGMPTCKVAPSGAIKSVRAKHFEHGGHESEVVANLKAVGWSGMHDGDRLGFCGHHSTGLQFDIVLANGYNKRVSKTTWLAKTYPHFEKVVAAFPHLKIASVGSPDEYIPGTTNMTGIGLDQTFGLINRAWLFVSNDTGLYHVAAALQRPALVLFTFSDMTKNHDDIFHRTATIIGRDDLTCRPCQLKSLHYWIKNKPVCQWACRDIPAQKIITAIEEHFS